MERKIINKEILLKEKKYEERVKIKKNEIKVEKKNIKKKK